MNAVKQALGQYNLKWGEELAWAVFMAFGSGAASVFLAGQGVQDRETWLLAVVAAGARPALAILGTRVSGAVAKLTASPVASSRYVPRPDGSLLDTETGNVYWLPSNTYAPSGFVNTATGTLAKPLTPAPPPNTIGGSV